jgi:hypothetical protein
MIKRFIDAAASGNTTQRDSFELAPIFLYKLLRHHRPRRAPIV